MDTIEIKCRINSPKRHGRRCAALVIAALCLAGPAWAQEGEEKPGTKGRGISPADSASAQASSADGQARDWRSFLTDPANERQVSIGGYTGTMGDGFRLSIDAVDKLAPFSITHARRDVTVQATTGESLDSSRQVTALAYEPGKLFAPKDIGGGFQLRSRLAFPVGMTMGSSKAASTQVTEIVPGPFPGSGHEVTRDIVAPASGTEFGAFAGVQPSLELSRKNLSFTVGVEATAGVPVSGGDPGGREAIRKDSTRLGVFVAIGLRF